MSSKRELRERAWDEERRALAAESPLSETRARYENALEQVAAGRPNTVFVNLNDAYVRTYTDWAGHTREFFDTAAFIADLVTIYQATSADEARKRLGIKEEA